MSTETDEANTQLSKYLAWKEKAEVKPIPINEKDKQEKPSVKKETPKNDDYNEYDYDERDPIKNKEMDDTEW